LTIVRSRAILYEARLGRIHDIAAWDGRSLTEMMACGKNEQGEKGHYMDKGIYMRDSR
jgi:hypothetical protein